MKNNVSTTIFGIYLIKTLAKRKIAIIFVSLDIIFFYYDYFRKIYVFLQFMAFVLFVCGPNNSIELVSFSPQFPFD